MKRSLPAFLLESYLLDALGELAPDRARATEQLVIRAFRGREASWRDVVREEFGLAPGVSDQVRAMWTEARALAEARGAELGPEPFVSMVVDENFGDTIEMVGTELTDPAD